MILDSYNEFCDAVALDTTAIGSALVGNVIDLGTSGRDIGPGFPIPIIIDINTAVTSAGSATVQFKVVSDSTANLATSPTTHVETAAIAVATLVAGYRPFEGYLPAGVYERYLGVLAVSAVATVTAGKIDAFIPQGLSQLRTLPDGI